MGKMKWYTSRLASMSVAELTHRFAERRKVEFEKRWPHSSPVQTTTWSADSPLRDYVLGLCDYPKSTNYRREAAKALTEKRLTLLGQPWPPFASFPEWQVDPVTGNSWPDSFSFSIDFRHATAGCYGDVKYVWELNRLQFLLPVAAHAYSTGDGGLGLLCDSYVRDWIDRNPIGRGVQWASSIEVALRAVTVIALRELTRELHVDVELDRTITRLLRDSLYWIHRFPSLYSSANNHRIAELAATLVIGSRFPDLTSPARTASSLRELRKEVLQQIHEDGIGAEQSTTYAASVVEWVDIVSSVMADSDMEVASDVAERITCAAQALRSFVDCGCHHVRIGDDDEGRVLSSVVPQEFYIDAITRKVVGPKWRERFGLTVYAAGGYTVARHSDAGIEILLV